MARENCRRQALLVPLICLSVSNAPIMAAADDLPKPETLETSAHILKGEATKLDARIQEFSRHGAKYKGSTLHQQVLKQNVPQAVQLKKEEPQFQKLTPAELAEQENTINALHAEYEGHVNQLAGLVDNYRNFFRLYADHVDQFKLQIGQIQKSEKADHLVAQDPKLATVPPAKKARLYASEKELNVVLKKMVALEDRGPTLPESVMCPAYDDLQLEFKKALGGLTLAVDALPKEKIKLVATEETVRIEKLQTQLVAVEKLHDQQQALQKEYLILKNSYADINKRQGQLTKELQTDTKLETSLEDNLEHR
jgi:hypothetical protein